MMEYESAFQRIFKTFNKYDVDYMVIGGVAVNLYGISRFTNDLDIVVDLNKKNLLKLTDAFSELSYHPRQPIQLIEAADAEKREEWANEKGAKALFFYSDKYKFLNIDILYDSPLNFSDAYSRKKEMNLEEGVSVKVVSLEDLIETKKVSNREIDMEDIRKMEIIKRMETFER